MIEIGKTLVSDDVVAKQFVCNLSRCKGACCVSGDSGAPLDKEELQVMEEIYEEVKPYMTKEGRKEVARQGVYVVDSDGDYVTPLLKGKGECAFTNHENGVAYCSIERAYREGKITFLKPVSCHLYPVRIKKYKNYDAVNYERWDICRPACELGKSLQVPVYEFVKEGLIRRYGQEWFDQLCKAAEYYQQRVSEVANRKNR